MAGVAVASQVVRAEVYARGARVTRRLELTNEAVGASELVVEGVSAHAVASSLRAMVEGPGAVRGVHSRLVRERTLDPAAIQKKLDAARNTQRNLETEVQWLRSRRDRLEQVAPRAHLHEEETEGQPRPTRSPEARVADALAVQRVRGGLLESVEAELSALEARQREQELICERLLDELSRGPQGRLSRTVTVELEPGELLPHGLEVTYVVPTARWWPAYTVRLEDGGQSARWQLEAFVCQVSGEAWEGVELSLATADLISDASFPDLPALRLGRPRKRPRAFRAPPEGLDALFAGFDRDQGRLLRAAAVTGSATKASDTGAFQALSGDPFEAPPSADPFVPCADMPLGALAGGGSPYGIEEHDDELLLSESEYDAFAEPTPAPAPEPEVQTKSARAFASASAPSADRARSSRRSKGEKSKKRAGRAPGGPPANMLTRDGSALGLPPEPDWSEPEQWLDFDGLEMQGASGQYRGRLRPAAVPALSYQTADGDLSTHQPPGNPADPLTARGSFDHRFVAAAPVDVPSGIDNQRVRLSELRTAVAQRLRCVPVVEERVYREAELINPCDAPLLAGPVEVFFDDAFLTRTHTDAVPRGGKVRIGLGEEERVRVVRRVTSEESAQGFLSGTTLVDHRVRYEVASQLGVPVELELLARVPVPGEDQALEVLGVTSTPACEPYPPDAEEPGPKGGRRFVLALEAGASTTCELHYRLSFSAKQEVEGGNVRG